MLTKTYDSDSSNSSNTFTQDRTSTRSNSSNTMTQNRTSTRTQSSKTKDVINQQTTTTSDLTNGEIQYLGALSFQENSLSNLISNFQFNWSQINQEDYDDETLTRSVAGAVNTNTLYDNLMNGEYATGITPFRFQYLSETDENNFFTSWEHGTTRPLFSYGVSNQMSSVYLYNISYEDDELSAIETMFARGTFQSALDEIVNQISNNISNQLNLDPKNQNLDFQKNKNKTINFKNLSKFDSKQRTAGTAETIVTSTIVNVSADGGY